MFVIQSELWGLYQTEDVPESSYQSVNAIQPSTSKKQLSYWEKAFQLAEVGSSYNNDQVSCDMESFVMYLEKLKGSDGKLKFPFLSCLLKIVLSISHENSTPENGFSINKYI
jgi:hypothetical protein